VIQDSSERRTSEVQASVLDWNGFSSVFWIGLRLRQHSIGYMGNGQAHIDGV